MTILLFLLLFVVAHFFISLFFHSFFLHRYGTHKQFTMSPLWERIFFFLTYLAQGSSFLNPKSYAILHSEHHAHSDTKEDPHSPLNFSFWKWGLDFPVGIMRMMGKTQVLFGEIKQGKSKLLSLYADKKFPTWPDFEKFASGKISVLLFVLAYAAIYFFLAPTWWVWFFILVNILTGPIQGAIVNWCGHMWGYTNFDNHDHSRNTPLASIFMLGELNQNNHHKNPQNPNFGTKWYELDLVFPIILFLNWVKIIRLQPVQSKS